MRQPDPAYAPKPGERVARAFGDTLARLHGRIGGAAGSDAQVRRWAQRVWSSAADGHVCVEVADPRERDVLAASPVVDAAGATHETGAAPLVLDGDALYLRRLWSAEERLAAAIVALDVPAPLGGSGALASLVDSLFAGGEADDAQRRALLRALGHRLTLLSGGPGTGKTTTLARLLVAFVQLAPDARVTFAAPTGKAAARLGQSLAAQLRQLDPSGELRRRLPDAGTTVHRLLGLRAGGVARSRAAPVLLDFDLILVDEASMLDIELAAQLLGSIGPDARLVLAGDRDQLASVEAGSVFADLCESAGDATVELVRNYRQKDAAHIVALAAQVRDAPVVGVEVREAPALQWPDEVALRRPDAGGIVADALAAWSEVQDAIDSPASAQAVLDACERHRVLTALREGPFGSVALNRSIGAVVRSRSTGAARAGTMPSAQWYPGRLVLVTANRPALGLFNGDVGVCLARAVHGEEEQLVVAFGGTADVRLFPVAQMPACEDAWAMTVHKSQGSEFESVALVLAAPEHPLNTRELAYTGITRARSRLVVWAEPDALARAARTPTVRHGRLAAKLAERIGR